MKSVDNKQNIVVVGGGVLALAVAYELLMDGKKISIIFPKSGDEESASRAAGAMLGAFGEVTADDGKDEVIELEFRLAAQRMYPEWLKGIKERAAKNIHQCMGSYIIANNDGVCDRASIHRMKNEANRLDEPAHWVEPEEVPGLNPSTNHAPSLCLFLPNENSIDSKELMDTLTQVVIEHENCTHVNEAVKSVVRQGDDWSVTTETEIEIVTSQVVLAAGSRSLQILDDETSKEAAIPDLYFGKGVSVLVKGIEEVKHTIRTPNRAFACGVHVVPRGRDGYTYVGATNFMGTDHEEEKGIQPAELHALFEDTIHQINTDIRVSRIEEVRVGYRPIATTRMPVIGSSKIPGLYVATGTYRNGILMAPLVAKIIAQEMGVANNEQKIVNPYPVFKDDLQEKTIDWDRLTTSGIRDIIRFIQEPHGPLPYDRAGELQKYIKVLFELAVREDINQEHIRQGIRDKINEAPFNETMHKLFYEIIAHVD